MSSSEECLFILHVYTVLHLYILIYFQDIDTGSLQIRLQVGLHERRFSTASGAEELDIHSSFYLSIENPAAIIIRTRDIRTDNQTPVTYACLIFGMLVYSYLRMMPSYPWKFLYHTLMILDNINGMWTLGVRHRDLVTVPSFNQDLPVYL